MFSGDTIQDNDSHNMIESETSNDNGRLDTSPSLHYGPYAPLRDDRCDSGHGGGYDPGLGSSSSGLALGASSRSGEVIGSG